jgi:integrase/recombinase XerD
MLEDLQIRNYSPNTVAAYIRRVAEFAKHFGKSPELLGPEEIREYQLYLIKDKTVSLSAYIQTVCGLRFLYSNTLHRSVSIDRIPLPRYEKKLPVILSPAEVQRLLATPKNLSHRTILTTMYAAGPRVSEIATLKPSDIDGGRGVIWIRAGKGRKDRQTLLPPKLLELLRIYFRWKRPKEWLFPGAKPDQPISTKSIFLACRKAAQKAGISKPVHPHSLRQASAYYTTFPTRFILKTIRLGQARSAAVYGPGEPLSPVAAQPAMTDPSGRLSTEQTLPHASPVECVLG